MNSFLRQMTHWRTELEGTATRGWGGSAVLVQRTNIRPREPNALSCGLLERYTVWVPE